MREQIKKKYTDKKKSRKFVFIATIALIIMIPLMGKNSMSISWSNNQNFAGEKMSTKGKYALNIERFDRELALIQLNPAQFVMIHKRWNLIIPTIEKELKKAGLPNDLKYIPVIESALRESVTSSAGAAGIWQFMPATAQRYGLVVNTFVDERMDVEKSTTAAIRYFQDLYKKFNNRTLAAAAYNRGENGLQTSMNNQFSRGYYDLWLNTETSRYVFRLLATKHIREHKHDFFNKNELWPMYTYFPTKNISVKKIDNLAERANNNGYAYYEVKKLNPRILKNSLPEGQWDIQVFSEK